MTSFAITLPRGPVPLILDKSIFFSDAVFLARGEAPTLDDKIFSEEDIKFVDGRNICNKPECKNNV